MQHEGLQAILAKVEASRVAQARDELRPYLLGDAEAPHAEICYVLGRTFFGQDNATARYLFELARAEDPDLREAAEYEARCGSGLGDLEDFSDERHLTCEACHFNYRDQEPRCPYCGAWPESGEPHREKESSFESQFRIAREEMHESFRDFTERKEVKRAVKKSKTLLAKFLARVQADQERFNRGNGTERAKVIGMWFAIGVVALIVLKWLFGAD